MTKRRGYKRKLLVNCGQSIVEVIVAVSVFIVIAGGAVVTILGSLSATRLAKEETQATMIATEGIEAVKSIRNKSWSSLTDGSHGLSNEGGAWIFLGTGDVNGKFNREIVVSLVERDENDNISGGGIVTDEGARKITSRVTWDFTSARANAVEVVTYLTNWKESRRVTSCSEYCQIRSYSDGTCRRNAQACTGNDEVNKADADVFCTGGSQEDTCCCLP